jgi:hypothetical protein
MLEDLVRPFAYLTVRHPGRLPAWVNWFLPGMLALLAVFLLWRYPLAINVFHKDGVLDRLLGFVQTLAGFYIAALAAVSAFDSPHMNRVMPGVPPEILVKHNNRNTWVKATRRRFLCAMFAYLTALSFLFTLGAIAVLSVADPISQLVSAEWRTGLRLAGTGLMVFLVTQMTTVTFWGLFYLGERMLTPD